MKKVHIDAAIQQRRVMRAFVQMFVKNKDPNFVLPETLLPNLLPEFDEEETPGAINSDSGTGEISSLQKKITVQGEDSGMGIAMPHYGYTRPSTDNYNSNLILNNFVVSDVVTGTNYIYYYDERGQEKGFDALCTLRLKYHLMKWHGESPPSISVSFMDNCVGQNKSQNMMKFYAMLSVLFYEEVAALFLISGHSHMLPDRATAHARNSMKMKHIWHPTQLVQIVNGVKNLKADFLDHN